MAGTPRLGLIVATSKKLKYLASLAVLLLLVVCGGYALIRNHVGRFYAFAGYANAIHYLVELKQELPPSIDGLENPYNKCDRRLVQLPSPPWYLRPEYRPTKGLEGGPYLVLIEQKPSGLNDWTRYVIYAKDDGSGVSVKNINESELAGLIADDDALRAETQRPMKRPTDSPSKTFE